MSTEGPEIKLESKKYRFLVEGTMPILEFTITPGSVSPMQKDLAQGPSVKDDATRQRLVLELYSPLSGEVFEAKFSKGRIEVDNDGAMTYFSTNAESVNLSLFLGRNVALSMDRKTGEVVLKSPSKIVSVEQCITSAKPARTSEEASDTSEATTDSIRFRLE